MAHAVIEAALAVPARGRSMRSPSPSRLVPLAGLLFVLGSGAGWVTVAGIKGCASSGAGGPAPTRVEPSGGSAGAGGDEPRGGEGAGREPAEPEPGEVTRNGEARAEPEGGEPERPEPSVPEGVPAGRAIGRMDGRACYALLKDIGVSFERRSEAVKDARQDVAVPLSLRGPVGDVVFEHVGRSDIHEVADCRLVVALVRWAALLRGAGVHRVEHMSMYRPDSEVRSTGEPSGHAVALAIDAARFELDDGRKVDVLEGWSDKKRGADPCAEREAEPEDQALLRNLVCEAVDRDIFQVAITPHHNRAHRNHVHLEIVEDVDWSYVR